MYERRCTWKEVETYVGRLCRWRRRPPRGRTADGPRTRALAPPPYNRPVRPSCTGTPPPSTCGPIRCRWSKFCNVQWNTTVLKLLTNQMRGWYYQCKEELHNVLLCHLFVQSEPLGDTEMAELLRLLFVLIAYPLITDVIDINKNYAKHKVISNWIICVKPFFEGKYGHFTFKGKPYLLIISLLEWLAS